MAPKGKIRARRRAVMGLVVTVIMVAVLLFAVFPTRTWLQQRKDTAAAASELAQVQAEKAKVEQEQAKLKTKEEIARQAKETLNYVYKGEEAYAILPAPTDPIGLPEGWPFTGVERVFGAR
ncbi:FtsB family cell division protein [Aquihabitans sp. McL0605]|uniref:FtsB family cell division protein n=1 Tax=Aquihabitans sp. McL0605 TaxID=3415671 RepID=UPI003CEA7E55